MIPPNAECRRVPSVQAGNCPHSRGQGKAERGIAPLAIRLVVIAHHGYNARDGIALEGMDDIILDEQQPRATAPLADLVVP